MNFQKIIIVKKYNTLDDVNELKFLFSLLQRLGKSIKIDLNASNPQMLEHLHSIFSPSQIWHPEQNFIADWVIAIGGDGSMLGAARNHGLEGVPITGINLGRVGFLTEISKSDMFEKIQDILSGNYKLEERHVLDIKVLQINDHNEPLSSDDLQNFNKEITQENAVQRQCFAINEIVFGRSQKLINCSMFIDNEMVANQYVDGLIIATPTGSTAYSLNAGGSILQPHIPANIIVPICPQNPANKPIVIDANSTVHLFHHSRYVDDQDDGSIIWSYDGLTQQPLQTNQYLEVKRAENKIKLLHTKQYSYFSNLNNKIFKN